ncbi:unnamed protein product, partial [Acanthoscelides obtectus]
DNEADLNKSALTALRAARVAIKRAGGRRKVNIPRIIPIPKTGGILPILPILGALGALGSLTGGAAAVAKTAIDVKNAKKQLAEAERHNRTIEAIALVVAKLCSQQLVTMEENSAQNLELTHNYVHSADSFDMDEFLIGNDIFNNSTTIDVSSTAPANRNAGKDMQQLVNNYIEEQSSPTDDMVIVTHRKHVNNDELRIIGGYLRKVNRLCEKKFSEISRKLNKERKRLQTLKQKERTQLQKIKRLEKCEKFASKMTKRLKISAND